MNDRLLTKEERDSICMALPNDATFGDELRALYAAQDAKTLKTVGKWLDNILAKDLLLEVVKGIEKMQRGEPPGDAP